MTNLKDECRDKVTRKENLSSSRSKGEKPVITPASLSALHLVQTSQPQVAASAGSSSGALSYSVGMENSEFLLEGEQRALLSGNKILCPGENDCFEVVHRLFGELETPEEC